MQKEKRICNNAFLKVPKESVFAKECFKRALMIIKKEREMKEKVQFGCIGPYFLDTLIKEFSLSQFVICVRQNPTRSLCDKNYVNVYQDEFYIHLGTEDWKGNHLEKDGIYNKNCIYEQLRQKYRLNEFLQNIGYKRNFLYLWKSMIVHWIYYNTLRVWFRNVKKRRKKKL
ncbi:hypothetical protein OQH60_07350 [Campylobacter sp. MIT 21-1685]|uniref:hypothetical protein n=1 Tax=unclassified Campylobacter TaxID=2593542 RepID=UPI00224B0E25|nr:MULTISPECIES: hypothetical protein [unclassified Campylobacter]MCX2683694.1 hypothetical protein [Campylobacter sp. MIT 21-1684]MCX2808159.1 hypothetical protein [Campylobacter sp. MIT 21-1685]